MLDDVSLIMVTDLNRMLRALGRSDSTRARQLTEILIRGIYAVRDAALSDRAAHFALIARQTGADAIAEEIAELA
uniref:hypothetical protein n=1 Tax=Herbidospora sakaeratensis TaxID=564415 RepID=UPI000784481C|nr:hypothetical protein [Herbidospora sakaeratensis]